MNATTQFSLSTANSQQTRWKQSTFVNRSLACYEARPLANTYILVRLISKSESQAGITGSDQCAVHHPPLCGRKKEQTGVCTNRGM